MRLGVARTWVSRNLVPVATATTECRAAGRGVPPHRKHRGKSIGERPPDDDDGRPSKRRNGDSRVRECCEREDDKRERREQRRKRAGGRRGCRKRGERARWLCICGTSHNQMECVVGYKLSYFVYV